MEESANRFVQALTFPYCEDERKNGASILGLVCILFGFWAISIKVCMQDSQVRHLVHII